MNELNQALQPPTVQRPKFVKDCHLFFLDMLRESGVTNMYGSAPYVMREWPHLGREKAVKVVSYWMQTFAERHGLTQDSLGRRI